MSIGLAAGASGGLTLGNALYDSPGEDGGASLFSVVAWGGSGALAGGALGAVVGLIIGHKYECTFTGSPED